MTNAVILAVEDFFHKLVADAKAVETKTVALTAAEVTALASYIQTQIGADIMDLAKTLIADFKVGDSWAQLEQDLIIKALGLGKTLLEGAATVALNTAQSVLFAQAAPASAAAPSVSA